MVTLEERGGYSWVFYGKSTDEKPVVWEGKPVPINSHFYCVDNRDLYFFDSDGTWKLSDG